MAPFITEGVVLEEEVVVTSVVNQAIWIIHPIGFRREMFGWADSHIERESTLIHAPIEFTFRNIQINI